MNHAEISVAGNAQNALLLLQYFVPLHSNEANCISESMIIRRKLFGFKTANQLWQTEACLHRENNIVVEPRWICMCRWNFSSTCDRYACKLSSLEVASMHITVVRHHREAVPRYMWRIECSISPSPEPWTQSFANPC